MYKYTYNIYINMEKECGIRVSERLRNKIKKAALAKNMSMVDYLESIVPEIKMVEMPK
jgi:predicted DNA binding CopG/RHH family protein